jgi:hypothetical protein
MSSRALALASAAAVALTLACAGARGRGGGGRAEPPRRSIVVPGAGALEVAVPPGWDVREGDGDEASGHAVELAPAGKPFVALLSPVVNPQARATEEGADTAQMFVELSRRKASETAVEQEIPLMELVGEGGVHGFWFGVTDRAMEGKEPQAGEYRHLVQGAAAVGPLLVAFTLLDNGPGPHRKQLLDLVRTARFVGEGGAPGEGSRPGGTGKEGGARPRTPSPAGGGTRPPAEGFEPDPDAVTVPLVVEDAARRVSALVDLPGFTMFKPRTSEDGKGLVVLGQHPDTGIVASMILRDAPGQDARACRDDALARIRKATPEVADVKTSDRAGLARASYTLAQLGGEKLAQRHAHAFAARNGVCVNLHLSKADPDAGDAARFEEILRTLRFGEAL